MVNVAHFGDYTDIPSWQRFVDSIKSEYTRYQYVRQMRKFIETAQIVNLDAFVRGYRKAVEYRIIEYVQTRQKVDGARSQTVAGNLSVISHFFVYNDRTDINWRIIKGYLGECVKSVKDRAYTIEEIRKMLTYVSASATVGSQKVISSIADGNIDKLHGQIETAILGLGNDIVRKPTNSYLGFWRKNGPFVVISKRRTFLTIGVRLKPHELHDPNNIAKIKGRGSGIAIRSLDEIDYAMKLIRQAYDKV